MMKSSACAMHDRRLFSRLQKRAQRLTRAERIALYSTLERYLRAGMPMRTALHLLRDNAPAHAAHLFEALYANVLEGLPLAHTFMQYPDSFTPLEANLIGIGEMSGRLPESLAHVAELLETRRSLARTVHGALLYPMLIALLSFAFTLLLLAYTFPKLAPIFENAHVQLPFLTRVLLTGSKLLTMHPILFALGFCATGLGIWRLSTLPYIRRAIEGFLSHLPFLRSMVRAYDLALIFRTLSVLLGSGATLVVALELSKGSSRQPAYAKALDQATESVRDGARLSAALTKNLSLFPASCTRLIAVGEETGKFADCLATAASWYEDEFKHRARAAASVVEPILMILMGVVVGSVTLSVMTPLYDLTQHVAS